MGKYSDYKKLKFGWDNMADIGMGVLDFTVGGATGVLTGKDVSSLTGYKTKTATGAKFNRFTNDKANIMGKVGPAAATITATALTGSPQAGAAAGQAVRTSQQMTKDIGEEHVESNFNDKTEANLTKAFGVVDAGVSMANSGGAFAGGGGMPAGGGAMPTEDPGAMMAMQNGIDPAVFGTDMTSMGVFMKEGGQLTEYTQGGKHEENPNGGIPLHAHKALVEEGETKASVNNYIFSDSLELDKDLAMEFGYGEKEIGKTFAEISKDVNKKHNRVERENDTFSNESIERELTKLSQAQETLKAYNQVQELNTIMKNGGYLKMEGGGNPDSTKAANKAAAEGYLKMFWKLHPEHAPDSVKEEQRILEELAQKDSLELEDLEAAVDSSASEALTQFIAENPQPMTDADGNGVSDYIQRQAPREEFVTDPIAQRANQKMNEIIGFAANAGFSAKDAPQTAAPNAIETPGTTDVPVTTDQRVAKQQAVQARPVETFEMMTPKGMDDIGLVSETDRNLAQPSGAGKGTKKVAPQAAAAAASMAGSSGGSGGGGMAKAAEYAPAAMSIAQMAFTAANKPEPKDLDMFGTDLEFETELINRDQIKRDIEGQAGNTESAIRNATAGSRATYLANRGQLGRDVMRATANADLQADIADAQERDRVDRLNYLQDSNNMRNEMLVSNMNDADLGRWQSLLLDQSGNLANNVSEVGKDKRRDKEIAESGLF